MSCNFSGHWWVSGNNYQCFIWQMLLPFVADVVATIDVGRHYCHCWLMLLPFFVADAIATFGYWQMF